MAYKIIEPVLLAVLSYECFRRLQGSNYRPLRGYFKLLLSLYFLTLLACEAVAVISRFYPVPRYVATVMIGVFAVLFAVIKRKSPLKFTKRACRIMIVNLLLLAIAGVFAVADLCVAFLPFIALLSLAICLPLDMLIARHYIKKAQKKLEGSDVTVIAITGSYGKTSVKDMLTALLSDAVSPSGSCNTPLGIASYINRTDLYYAKYLVLEFGAKNRGDIAELCRLYKPTHGIITGVCAQHLSTFKTIDNIVATKGELVESLPENGVCVLNAADELAMSYVDAGVCQKITSKDDLSVELESVSVDGVRINVSRGKTVKQVRLPQITAHTSDTLALCVAMCLALKQSLAQTVLNAQYVKQTPHRMEISKAQNCYIIDDGYNASIIGVKSAVRTLSSFDKSKIVITQGLVECGRQRRELNVECGRLLGSACNAAIVVGKNKNYLAEGLRQTDCEVIFAKNLHCAVELAQPYLNGEESILLFQNDLPD